MRISGRLLLSGALLAFAGAGSACAVLNTIPDPVLPQDPVQYYDLDLPGSLEVRSVSFDAALVSDVSGSANLVASQVGGRGFLKVYAVDRQSGQQYLLIYENIRERKRPVQIIRFRAAPGDALLTPPPPA